ncbi:MAG: hypothetical protein Fur0037_22930 [Planctomycetota bacterium]
MKKKFKDALHKYKVEAFKISHRAEDVEELAQEILTTTEQALENAYRFHFHQDPSPHRIETMNLIKHFVLEALLPPVLEKVMRRVVILEKQHAQLVGLLDSILKMLSEDENNPADGARAAGG